MLIVALIATVVLVLMVLLILMSKRQSEERLQHAKLVTVQTEQKELQIQLQQLFEYMKENEKLSDKKLLKKGKNIQKKLKEKEKKLTAIQEGKADMEDIILLPGYSVIRLLQLDPTSGLIKKLRLMCIQIRQREDAMDHAYYLVAYFLGFAFLAVWGALGTCAFALAMDLGGRGIVLSMAVLVLLLVVGYLPYSTLDAEVKRRAEEIERQFPQAISQMTLLIVAGQEVNRAWNISSEKEEGVLYEEMRRVSLDVANNVQPAEAYMRFMDRCNNPYTTKLATSILQNISKGNAEIVKVFRRLNEESWSERKHSVRRYAEVVQSKLLIPTLLMFAGIIAMVIVPVMSGFDMM